MRSARQAVLGALGLLFAALLVSYSVLQAASAGTARVSTRLSDKINIRYWIGAYPAQYATLSLYLAASSATPDPPSSAPKAFRIIVMGCMGNSLSTSWALTETMPQGASLPESSPMAAFSILICSREYRIKSRYFAVGAATDSFGNHLDNTASSFSVLDE